MSALKINPKILGQLVANCSSRIQLWESFLQVAAARSMAEVGVWKGEFACEMLHRCDLIQRYYMIDPWSSLPDWNKPFNVSTENFEEVYEEAMRKTEFAAERRIVLRGRTKEVIDQIPDRSLDFIYIDGDHTLRGITIDLIRLIPKVKEGGMIGGDDFSTDPWQHGVAFEPTLVCPLSVYFAEAMDLPIVGLPFNQFMIQKIEGAQFSFVDAAGTYQDISLNTLLRNRSKSPFRKFVRQIRSKLRS